MRLFIAINFDENIKRLVKHIINEIKKDSIQGRFVKEEHLHLTLKFIGQVSHKDLDKIMRVMDRAIVEGFTMKLKGIDFFKRKDGHIYFIGVEENRFLFDLQRQIHEGLKAQGFSLEDRVYKPHITIGRRIKLNKNFSLEKLVKAIDPITIDVCKIDLMKSEHINGELVYSPIYTRRL
ncbi:MAG: RNA 2',3'-cyclic phosphodiesterase [Clostridiales bacterium]|nr:RNA 2',3'-cyclic phosphodiesterase [Clostridiales bacterium]